MNNLGDLPTELLSLILEKVNKSDIYTCAFVNRNFYAASIPLLWRTIMVNNDDDEISNITTSLLQSPPQNSLGHYVRHLHLGYFTITDDLLSQWMPHLPNLETLEILSGKAITDTGFQHITGSCPKLRSLELRYGAITQHSMRALGQKCHQLDQLELFGCTQLGNDTLSTLLDCPLQKLVLGVNISFSLDWMTVEETMVDLMQYHLLTDISLTHAPMPFMKQLLSSASTTTWPHLTHLTLEGYNDLGEHGLIGFIKSHTRLESLTLISVDLTDTTLDAISAYLSDVLTYIDVSRNYNITHQGLRRMVRQCRMLTCVSLYGCDQTTVNFPEAGTGCVEGMVRRLPIGMHERYLHQLDQDAIISIRIG